MNIRIIEASHLNAWADKPSSRDSLPEIIYRLIRETCDDFSFIHFPSEAAVSKPGFDGILDITSGFEQYVLDGKSVWEMGCDKNHVAKANKDWNKRIEDEVDYSETTFIFITPREWQKKQDWINGKRKLNIFKDVKVWDRVDLVQWLDDAPITALFIAKEIGSLPKDGIEPSEFFYKRKTRNSIGTKIIVGGRENIKNNIGEYIRRKKTFHIRSHSSDEAILFALASLKDVFGEDYLKRTLICNSENGVKFLSLCKKEHVVIAQSELLLEYEYELEQQGHLIIGVDQYGSLNRLREVIELRKYDLWEQQKALESELQLPSHIAKVKSKNGQGMLHKLLRSIFDNSSFPKWYTKIDYKYATSALLLGEWDEKDNWQSTFLNILSVENIPDFYFELQKFQGSGDDFVYNYRTIWKIKDIYEAMNSLYDKFIDQQILDFKDYAILSLSNKDPHQDKEGISRIVAQIHGEKAEVSNLAKKGVFKVLSAINQISNEDRKASDLKSIKDQIIKEVLFDFDISSLRNNLPYVERFAEASPDLFIDFISELLNVYAEEAKELLKENSTFTSFPQSFLTNILWALEGLSHLANFKHPVLEVLNKLVKIDQGGSLSNRPINSLTTFLHYRNTSKKELENNTDCILKSMEKNPDQALNIFNDIIFTTRRSFISNSKVYYSHDYEIDDSGQFTWGDYYKEIEKIFPILINNLISLSKEQDLIQILYNLQKPLRLILLQHIKERLDQFNLNTQFFTAIKNYQSSLDSKEIKSQDELTAINLIVEECSQHESSDSLNWIFTNAAFDLISQSLGVKRYDENLEKEIFKQRQELLNKELKKGIDRIVKILETKKDTFQILHVLKGILNKEQASELIYKILESYEEGLKYSLNTFIPYYSNQYGLGWIKYSLRKINNKNHLEFLLFCSSSLELWDYIKEETDVNTEYWMSFRNMLNFEEAPLKKKGVENLVSVGRASFGIKSLGFSLDDIEPEFLLNLLHQILETEVVDLPYDLHSVEKVFERLNKSENLNTVLLGNLEFQFAPILIAGYPKQGIPNLSRIFYSNPKELFKFLSDFKTAKSKNELIYRRDIIENLEKYPSDLNPEFIEEKTREWITEIRNLAEEEDSMIKNKIDYIIGGVLSRIPKETRYMPQMFVYQILEELSNEEVTRGFIWGGKTVKMGSMNSDTNIEAYKKDLVELKKLANKFKFDYKQLHRILYYEIRELENRTTRWDVGNEYDQENEWLE